MASLSVEDRLQKLEELMERDKSDQWKYLEDLRKELEGLKSKYINSTASKRKN